LQFVAGGLDDFQLETQFGKRFAALRCDQVRLRERECAAARGDYYWSIQSHFLTTDEHGLTRMKRNLTVRKYVAADVRRL
jgi:hypothetical protein